MKEVYAIWYRMTKDDEWGFWGFAQNGKAAKQDVQWLKNQGRQAHSTKIEMPE